MRLGDSTLRRLPDHVAQPAYDRSRLRTGVVHLGPGAFHRAHQAPVFDDICARDPRWGISGVSLHSCDVRDALTPQDGLYTLVTLDEVVRHRVVGAVREVLVAPENPEAVLARLASPATHIVSLTITEKGYWRAPDGSTDTEHPAFRRDAAAPERPSSAIGYLTEALRRRRAAKLKPFVLLSCDNLVDNGPRLASSIVALAAAQNGDAGLLSWLAAELAAPPTMVDSITPATDAALRIRVRETLGVEDAWPIQRESFTQWVIEADPRLPELPWAEAGVTLAADVSLYERAKLRMLNASHSGLAYLGLLRGYETVAEAMADPALAAFAAGLMDDLGVESTGAFDPQVYKQTVLRRFRNPHIRHLLSQIAWDGSQKLPNRIVPYVLEALQAGGPLANSARVFAAWFHVLRRKAQAGDKLVDPLAADLLARAAQANGEPAHDTALFLSLAAVFPPGLAAHEAFRTEVCDAYAQLAR